MIIAEHDLLLVVAQVAGRSWMCAVGHAPHALSGHRRLDSWWRKFGAMIDKYGGGMPIIAFIDANAAVGGLQSEAIGGHGQEVETFAGSCFRSFLECKQLIAPSTFQHWHVGPSPTWVHPTGPKVGRTLSASAKT